MIKRVKKKYKNLDIHTAEVLKKSFSSTFVKVAGMIVGLGVSIFLGRTIGADGLGIINLSNRIVNIVIIIGLLGMRQVIIKEVAIAHNKNDFKHIGDVMYTAYWLNGGITLALSIILILLSPWLSNHVFHELRLTYPLMIALLVMTPQVFSRIFSSALVGFGKIWQSNLVEQTLSIAITAILIGILLLFKLRISINRIAVLYAIGRLVVTLSVGTYWQTLYKKKTKPRLITYKLTRTSLPLFWVTITTIILSNISIIFLGWLGNVKQVGLFTVASQIALITSFFLQVTEASISSKIAALYENKRIDEMTKMVQRVTKMLIMIGVIQVVILVIGGNFVLSLWGKPFQQVYTILIILSIGQLFNIGTGAAGTLLVMCGYEKTQKKISLMFVPLSLIANYLSIRYYGIYGAAIATSLTIIGINITRLIAAKIKTGVSTISF